MLHVLEILADVLFHTVCAWVGHIFIKVLTLGSVDLDWREGSESVVCEWTGLGVLAGLGLLAAWLLR
jgi:hypothetical protein